MVSMKHCPILHGVDSARPIDHGPIAHENNRVPYRLGTPPICHWLDSARTGYAKTIQHRPDCARIGYAQTPGHRLDCAPLQLRTYARLITACASQFYQGYPIELQAMEIEISFSYKFYKINRCKISLEKKIEKIVMRDWVRAKILK